MLALVTVKDEEVEPPGWDDLYEIGTAAIVHKMIRVPDGTLRILVQGVDRIRLERRVQDEPYLVGEFVEVVPDVVEESPELEALTRNVQDLVRRASSRSSRTCPRSSQLAAANVDDPSALSHLVASTLRLKTEEKQELLETADVERAAARRSRAILNRELEVVELGTKIQSQVQSEMEKGQREYFLRQQLKAIQDELGEGDEQQAELDELRERLEELNLPEDARKAAERELARLEKLPPAAAEYGVIRTYLDWILTLPWDADDRGQPRPRARAREILDEDHFDLEKVKERILEYLAVSKLKSDVSGPILCFVGPPGVGKTSLGQSIARDARAQVRAHLGRRRPRRGRDPRSPAHLHRRDARHDHPRAPRRRVEEPGLPDRRDRQDGRRLPRRSRRARCSRCSTPSRTRRFRDHYLDLPFDLSKVLFICTANQLETIPGPLLDRMDVIQLSGYTEDEKLGIAQALPRARSSSRRTASRPEQRRRSRDEALRLDRSASTRARPASATSSAASPTLLPQGRARVAEGKTRARSGSTRRKVREWLGPRRFSGEVRKRTSDPGVATGLAVHAGRRRRPLHRGDRLPGQGPARRSPASSAR